MIRSRRPLVILCAALALAACKKQDDAKPQGPPPAPAPAPAAPAPEPVVPAAPAPAGDYVEVLGTHSPAKPSDPVHVAFKSFKVVSASFSDAKNLEGAAAELEIDLGSLDSGNGMRDSHLQSPAYFDVASFGKATIKVHDVKKGAAEGKYGATADISVHGVSVSWPVEFQVLSSTADSVRVHGEHTMKRSDFKVGKTPEAGDTTAEEVTLRLELTLKKI